MSLDHEVCVCLNSTVPLLFLIQTWISSISSSAALSHSLTLALCLKFFSNSKSLQKHDLLAVLKFCGVKRTLLFTPSEATIHGVRRVVYISKQICLDVCVMKLDGVVNYITLWAFLLVKHASGSVMSPEVS